MDGEIDSEFAVGGIAYRLWRFRVALMVERLKQMWLWMFVLPSSRILMGSDSLEACLLADSRRQCFDVAIKINITRGF